MQLVPLQNGANQPFMFDVSSLIIRHANIPSTLKNADVSSLKARHSSKHSDE